MLTPFVACAQWWNIPIPSTALNDMKAAKYRGTYADLNIYTTMMQDNVLGCDMTAWVIIKVQGQGQGQGRVGNVPRLRWPPACAAPACLRGKQRSRLAAGRCA